VYNRGEVIEMKKILTIILVILAVVSLIGCNQDYLQNYKEAVEKTDGRSQGKESIKITINNDFNQENISQEIIEELNYLKNIEFEITSSFNEYYSKSRAYIKYRGLGYDINLYTGESETLVQIPIKRDGGEILYKGKDIGKNPKEIQRELGFVPQEIALYPSLSGYENLKFWGKIYGLKGDNLRDKIKEISKIIGIDKRLKDKVEEYSGGMKRRL
jgi:energy-coupling factor transporter ATP-binding protein EcfA2